MPDFYVTLDSSATDEFPGNTPVAFQRRLPTLLNLTKGKWKVGMTSLILPDVVDTDILIGSMDKDTVLADVELSYIESSTLSANKIKVKQEDVVSKVGTAPTPRKVMQAIVDMYNEKKLQKPASDYVWTVPSHPTLNRLDLVFKWKTNGELLMDNSLTYLTTLSPDVSFNVFFALKMGWIEQTADGYKLGPNLSYEILTHTDGSNRLADDLDAIWRDGGLPLRSRTSYWGVYKNTQIYLSVSASWTFKFQQEQHVSSLIQVHSSAVKSSIVNDTMHSLLEKIIYKKEGLGLVYIEPRTIHYSDIDSPLMEIISVTLLDSAGLPFNLEGGNTTITLHFKREW